MLCVHADNGGGNWRLSHITLLFDVVQEKLVKLFSLQLVTKRHLPVGVALPSELQQYPSLKQWLQVVGLSKDSIYVSCT